jgi:hypothetical protein
MAHFAKVEDGIVTNVIVADQEFVDNQDGTWVQTSYNTYGNVHYGRDGNADGGVALRGNYAALGFEWDQENNIFWPKSPYASWVKHIESASWKSPIGDAPELTAEQKGQIEALNITL